MMPIIVQNPTSFTIKTGLIECPECGDLMHVSMDMCGECINDGSFFVARGQRVITSTRRNFNNGY